MHWLIALTHALPRHERASALPVIARIRDALRAPLPLGTERLLARVAAQSDLTSALRIIEEGSRGRGAVPWRRVRVAALVIAVYRVT